MIIQPAYSSFPLLNFQVHNIACVKASLIISTLHCTLKRGNMTKLCQDLNQACQLQVLNKVIVKSRKQFQVPQLSASRFKTTVSKKKQKNKPAPTYHQPLNSFKTGQTKVLTCLETKGTSLTHSFRGTLLPIIAGAAMSKTRKIAVNRQVPIETHSCTILDSWMCHKHTLTKHLSREPH